MISSIIPPPPPKKIKLENGYTSLSTPVTGKIDSSLSKEAYRIHITEQTIILEGDSRTGLFYAQCTLEQLILQYKDQLPCMEIEDAPMKESRAFHLDCARHFIPVDELKKMISMCARFKLNTFHWHFSDDQGWRIESKAFPLLHEIGGNKIDGVGRACLIWFCPLHKS